MIALKMSRETDFVKSCIDDRFPNPLSTMQRIAWAEKSMTQISALASMFTLCS
jgi:hypothetical protein